jgi:hypothetical protein
MNSSITISSIMGESGILMDEFHPLNENQMFMGEIH